MRYSARSILALDLSPFGRSLALLPAMRALRQAYPKALLVVAASSGTCELLRASGLADETIELGVIKPSNKSGALRRLISLARRSARYDFDLLLDFSPRLETQIVSRLVLRARTITPSKLPRAIEMLLGFAGVPPRADNSAFADYASVLKQLGVEITDTRLAVTATSDDDARFERLLSRSGSRGGELIVLLYASDLHDGRGWPLEAFAEVGTRLANNLGARIIAADQPSDDAFTNAVAALLPPGVIRLGEPGAAELVAAIARASVVITDDPGIAQIASELHTPVIEIADSSSPAVRHRVVEASSRKRVSPDEVYDLASEIIQEGRSLSLFERP